MNNLLKVILYLSPIVAAISNGYSSDADVQMLGRRGVEVEAAAQDFVDKPGLAEKKVIIHRNEIEKIERGDSSQLEELLLDATTVAVVGDNISRNSFKKIAEILRRKSCVKILDLEGGTSIDEIGDSAFAMLYIRIGVRIFTLTPVLTFVNMPQVRGVGAFAFNNCRWLQAINVLSVKSIGRFAFSGCEGLRYFRAPVLQKVDGRGVFDGCENLVSFDAPYLEEIPDRMFFECERLVSVDVQRARVVGRGAFSGLKNLEKVDAFGVSTVASGAFERCVHLRQIEMYGARDIGDMAFDECVALKRVSMPYVERIRNYAFRGCVDLERIKMHRVKHIGCGAFYECAGLQEASLPEVEMISSCAFRGCVGLRQVEMPRARDIGYEAFYGCAGLKEASLPEVERISDYAFWGCVSLERAEMLRARDIGDWAFSGCVKFGGDVNLPEVCVLGDAFEDCPITRITVPIRGLRVFAAGSLPESCSIRFMWPVDFMAPEARRKNEGIVSKLSSMEFPENIKRIEIDQMPEGISARNGYIDFTFSPESLVWERPIASLS
jgi:hypothetical protein